MVEYEEDKTQIHQIDVPPYVRLLSIPDPTCGVGGSLGSDS